MPNRFNGEVLDNFGRKLKDETKEKKGFDLQEFVNTLNTLDPQNIGSWPLAAKVLVYIIVFQYVLAYQLSWFPVQGWSDNFTDNLFKFALLPILIMLVVSIAPTLRLYRSFILDEINQDYVRTARAKGLTSRQINMKHVLRAAITPIITVFGIDLGLVLGGAVITEYVFNIPGLGKLATDSVSNVDLPVVTGTVLFAAFFIIVSNIIVDLLYAVLDPKVRLS